MNLKGSFPAGVDKKAAILHNESIDFLCPSSPATH
jgi:hypothetical protein